MNNSGVQKTQNIFHRSPLARCLVRFSLYSRSQTEQLGDVALDYLHSGPTPRGSPLAVASLPWERALKSTSASIRRIVSCVLVSLQLSRTMAGSSASAFPCFYPLTSLRPATGQLANLRHFASCQELPVTCGSVGSSGSCQDLSPPTPLSVRTNLQSSDYPTVILISSGQPTSGRVKQNSQPSALQDAVLPP